MPVLLAQMMRYPQGTPVPQYYGGFGGRGMMGWAGTNPGLFWVYGILSFITWVLVIAALVAFIRWIWKKGDRSK